MAYGDGSNGGFVFSEDPKGVIVSFIFLIIFVFVRISFIFF